MDLIIPVTYAEVNGEHWSWCESKMNRLLYKKGIADAAVDGVVPEGKLRTPAQAYQDTMGWLERLDAGELQVIARPQINVPLPDRDPADVQRRQRLCCSRCRQRIAPFGLPGTPATEIG